MAFHFSKISCNFRKLTKLLIACCHFAAWFGFQQSHKNQSVCNDKWNIYFLENWKWKIPMIRFSPLSKPPPTSYRSTLQRVWYDNFCFLVDLHIGRIHLPLIQDLNRTLMDNTSVKWSIIKTFLFFIWFWWNLVKL